jgi:hypothetical protein
MTRVKTIEFWLFALPVIFVAVALFGGFDRVSFARPFIAAVAVTWMLLAIAWMFRELLRWIRS